LPFKKNPKRLRVNFKYPLIIFNTVIAYCKRKHFRRCEKAQSLFIIDKMTRINVRIAHSGGEQ